MLSGKEERKLKWHDDIFTFNSTLLCLETLGIPILLFLRVHHTLPLTQTHLLSTKAGQKEVNPICPQHVGSHSFESTHNEKIKQTKKSLKRQKTKNTQEIISLK